MFVWHVRESVCTYMFTKAQYGFCIAMKCIVLLSEKKEIIFFCIITVTYFKNIFKKKWK